MFNSKFEKLFDLIMQDINPGYAELYDKIEEEFKANLSLKEKVAMDFGQLNMIGSSELIRMINIQANAAGISMQEALTELNLIDYYHITFGEKTEQELLEIYGRIPGYKKPTPACSEYNTQDGIFYYDSPIHDKIQSEYWSLGLDINEKFNEYLETSNIELPEDQVCKSWGTLNGISGKTSKLFQIAYRQHDKMKAENPEAHQDSQSDDGHCWHTYKCSCGFSYSSDSSD